ncbi:MAG: cytochrome d ubiquinol oxidase subunit II [Chitinophagaceae bacterium]|nr:MAG: cytochrome d ubiquinol oxidase subunit II [Chitinophagaceae bacterium]
MKRKALLFLLLMVLAGFAGYLLSKASLIGRVGISVFYKQYKFLKTWWQGGLLIFAVWMLLFFLQGLAQRKLSPAAAKRLQVAAIVAALVGLYFTYQDFQHTTSHRWLGERFHLGGYLFWIGWIIISVFYLAEKPKTVVFARSSSANESPETASSI